jgi:hypothetical protein
LVVLCAGSTLLMVQSYAPNKAPYINCLEPSPGQLASIFGSWFFLLLVRLNLGFILRETCCFAHHTFLLGFLTGCLPRIIKYFSSAIAGEKEDFCKGSLSLSTFYFVIVLLTFFTLFLLVSFFIENTKKFSFFYSWYFVTFTFSLLCCSLSTSWKTFQ